jgi:hypothetical protein
LHLTVVELNEAIHGEAGAQVKTSSSGTGTIATIVRKGVAIISELMVALAKGMEVAGNLILGADAVFALLEVVLDTLDAMVYAVGGTVAYLSGAKEGGAADLSALDSLRAPLAEAKAFLGESGLVADLLPSPSARSAASARSSAILLGSRADLQAEDHRHARRPRGRHRGPAPPPAPSLSASNNPAAARRPAGTLIETTRDRRTIRGRFQRNTQTLAAPTPFSCSPTSSSRSGSPSRKRSPSAPPGGSASCGPARPRAAPT